MRKNICLLLLLLFLFSCIDKQNNEVAEPLALKSESVQCIGELPLMKVPLRVGLESSRLVMLDLVSDSCYYHILEYPSLKYLYSVGAKGQGDDEMVLSTPFQLKDGNLYAYDGAKGNVFVYDLQEGKLMRKLPTYVRGGIDFVCETDSTFFMEDMSGKSRLIRWTPSGTKTYFSIPTSDKEQNVPNKAYVWRSYMTYHPMLGRVAMASQFGGVLELYDVNKFETVKIRVDDEELYPSEMGEKRGYCDVQWVGDELYALFSQETTRDRKRLNMKEQGGNILQIFDKDGNLKREFKLDIYINGFAVDLSNNRLIGITPNEDCPICYWTLP